MITTLRILGMTCNGCVTHVDKALRSVPGVSAVEVSLADQAAAVVHDPERSSQADLIAAVVAEGYEATSGEPAAGPG